MKQVSIMKYAVTIFILLTTLCWAGPMNKTVLVKGDWGPEQGDLGLFLSFKKNGKYTFEMQGPGGMDCSGKYKIKGNKVKLLKGSTNHNDSVDCSPKTCALKKDKKSLYHETFLRCAKEDLYQRNQPIKANQKRKIKKVSAITMGLANGQTTDAVRMRSRPSTKGKKLYCREEIEDGEGKRRSTLRKGTEITVIARTEKKSKIGKRNAYWYYVYRESDGEIESCDSEEFWVYGAFVKVGK